MMAIRLLIALMEGGVMEEPLVSVLMVNYNHEETIGDKECSWTNLPEYSVYYCRRRLNGRFLRGDRIFSG